MRDASLSSEATRDVPFQRQYVSVCSRNDDVTQRKVSGCCIIEPSVSHLPTCASALALSLSEKNHGFFARLPSFDIPYQDKITLKLAHCPVNPSPFSLMMILL